MSTYTFELTFTGLCVYTFLGGDKRNPSEASVLLVDTRQHQHGGPAAGPSPDLHLALLSYDPRNLERSPTPRHRLSPAPDGVQIALQDLAGKALEVVPPPVLVDAPPRTLTATWRPAAVTSLPMRPDRNDPSQEDWLDWVISLQRANPETPDPVQQAPFAGLKHTVLARVHITQGSLRARGFPRQLNGDYEVWDFKVPGTSAIQASQAMAGSIVLSIHDLPHTEAVVLTDSQFQVSLRPFQLPDGNFTSVVRASVTNLPEVGPPPPLPEFLDHFAHFYDLVAFQPSAPKSLRLPHPRGATITSDNSFCPPSGHTKGG